MGKSHASRRRFSQMVVAIAALALPVLSVCTVEAASFLNNCTIYCHGTPPRDGSRKGNPHFASQSSAFIGNHRNHLSALPTTNDCGVCHLAVAASNFGHQNEIIEMAAKLKGYSAATGRARYDKGRFFNQTSIPALGNATCSNVNCHFETKTPAWGSAAYVFPTDCNICHGAPPAGSASARAGGLAGSHARHDTYFAGTTGCQKCHPAYSTFSHATSAGRPLKVQGFLRDPANLLESAGTYSGAGTNYLPSLSSAQVFGSCNTIYCHSSAQGSTGTGPLTYQAATWGGPAMTCGSCHKNMANDSTGTGSHQLHATALTTGNGTGVNYTCQVCHGLSYSRSKTPTGGTHVDKTIGLTFTTISGAVGAGTSYGKTGSFSPGVAYGQCSGSACHGAGKPVWGANTVRPACFKCHGSTVAAFTNPSAASVAPGYNNEGRDTGGNTSAASPRVGTHQAHLTGADNISATVHCGECHAVHQTVRDATHLNFSTATVTFGPLARTAGHAPAVSRTAGVISCSNTYCHTGNRSGATAVSTTPAFNSTVLLGNSTITDTCINKCHGMPPGGGVAGDSHVGLTANGTYTTPASLSACSSQTGGSGCHPSINGNPASMANIFFEKAMHINGAVEGGDCVACHSTVQGKRAAAAGQFASQSHHIQGAEMPAKLNGTYCYKCHWEANSDGSINATYHDKGQNANGGVSLVIWNGPTRPTTVIPGTTYVAYTANGSRQQIAKLNPVCIGCHNSANAATTPFGTYRTDQYSPEQYLATAQPKTSIQSRYSSTRTVIWSQSKYSSASGGVARFGTNNKSQITKALSAHGNAVRNQFPQFDITPGGKGDDGYVSPDTAASATLGTNRNVFCFDCHNSHGSNASGITSSYSSATGRNKGGLLKTSRAGEAGYTVTYTPAARTVTYRQYSAVGTIGATFNPGASLCNDCHNDPDSSPAGIARGLNFTRPWSITGTYSSTRAIVGYWSTPYFDNYTFNTTKRTAYKAGTAGTIKDLRKPMGGHYGSSVSGVPASHTAGSRFEINGLCTPCHDPHGVSNALGASGTGSAKAGKDYGIPLLKGTWSTSPYREDKADKIVKRGGGCSFTGIPNAAAVPGYHIDQNTFMITPAPVGGGAAPTTVKNERRSQRFRSFSLLSTASTMSPNQADTVFAGLCINCHTRAALTGSAAATTSAPWMSKERVHQSVAGWASTNGVNSANKVHNYTCAKCHAPHLSRLPRLLVTNCLDARHFGQRVTGSLAGGQGINSVASGTTTPGNIFQSIMTSSALGAGRFPAGGSRYSGTPTTAQNPGGWWFQTNGAANTSPPATTPNATNTALSTSNYGSACHNSAGANGSTTYNPATQIWNRKSRW